MKKILLYPLQMKKTTLDYHCHLHLVIGTNYCMLAITLGFSSSALSSLLFLTFYFFVLNAF